MVRPNTRGHVVVIKWIDILPRPLVLSARASGAKNPKMKGLVLMTVYTNNVLTKYFIHGSYK